MSTILLVLAGLLQETEVTISNTLTAVRQDMLEKMGTGFIVKSGYVDSTNSTTSVIATTDPDITDTNKGAGYLRDKKAWLYRPTAANAGDVLRRAGNITQAATYATITLAGLAYTQKIGGAATEEFEVWYDLRPDLDILPAIQQAQSKVASRTLLPFTLVTDGDMWSSGVTNWTGSSATPTKTTTPSRVFQGHRSLVVTNSGANGYAASDAISVIPGHRMLCAAIGRLNAGTATEMTLYDASNTAVFGETRTHAEGRFQYMWQEVNVPTGCHSMQVRLGGTGASDVTDWSGCIVVDLTSTRQALQSQIEEAWEFECLTYLKFNRNTSSGVEDANSLTPYEVDPRLYRVADLRADANQCVIQLDSMDMLGYPLMIQAGLKDYTANPLTTESSTTTQPLNLLSAASIMELIKSHGNKVKDSQIIMAQAAADFEPANRVRPAVGPARRQRTYSYGSMRG